MGCRIEVHRAAGLQNDNASAPHVERSASPSGMLATIRTSMAEGAVGIASTEAPVTGLELGMGNSA
jgi:hypothetical protein